MPTEAQRKANRQNAKKSTGPRTEEGKARSSQNGLKHGLLARDAVMADEEAKGDGAFLGPSGAVASANIEPHVRVSCSDSVFRHNRSAVTFRSSCPS